MKHVHLLAAACATTLTMTQAAAAGITQGSVSGAQLTTFDDVTGGGTTGTNYDAIFVSGGVSFAERFDGQSNTPTNNFDALSGTPSGSLSLAAGLAGQNLNVLTYNATNVLSGLGPLGVPNLPGDSAIGEGSFAVLFTTDQSEFGFDLIGGNGGSATLDFFQRDGSLIDTIVLSGLSDQTYGFLRNGGIKDIAGVSVYNSDPGGIGVDNVRYDVRSGNGTVPEPTSLALTGLALLGLAASRRRKA